MFFQKKIKWPILCCESTKSYKSDEISNFVGNLCKLNFDDRGWNGGTVY